MQKSDKCGEAGCKFENICRKTTLRKELQSQENTGAIEGATENTYIWSSERCRGASVLGKTHTEEEHGEKLIPFRNYQKVRTKGGGISGKERALMKLNPLRFYMMKLHTR